MSTEHSTTVTLNEPILQGPYFCQGRMNIAYVLEFAKSTENDNLRLVNVQQWLWFAVLDS